jgi:CheY-like chemotaxis protein
VSQATTASSPLCLYSDTSRFNDTLHYRRARFALNELAITLPEYTIWQAECRSCSHKGQVVTTMWRLGPRWPNGQTDVHSFQVQLMRVLLLNLSTSSAQEVSRALQGEGHAVVKASNLGIDEIISFQTQVLIAEATPSDLSSCHLISRMKSITGQPLPKIVLIVYGGALERYRGLELGADDVLSAPIEVEVSAQIKAAVQRKQSGAHREIQATRTLEGGRSVGRHRGKLQLDAAQPNSTKC